MFELKDPTAKHSNSKIADVSISKKFWHCMGWWSIHEKFNKNHAKPTFDSLDFWDFKTFHFLLILSPSNFVIEVSQSVLTRKLQVTILPPLTPRIFDVGGTTATFWQKTTQKQNSKFFSKWLSFSSWQTWCVKTSPRANNNYPISFSVSIFALKSYSRQWHLLA